MTRPRLLFLAGSLRAASASRALAQNLITSLSERAECSDFDIGSLPHYNADLTPPPAPVIDLNTAVSDADGLVIITPEYNFSVPGVLKNALDWASRPAYQSVLRGKPALVISVSGGALGGVRAQAHLKYILNGVLADVFPWQEIVVPQANQKIVDGKFQDEATEAFIAPALDTFLQKITK